MMAHDPRPAPRRAGTHLASGAGRRRRIDATRSRCSAPCSPRPAATWPSGSPTCATSATGSSPRCSGMPMPGVPRPDRPSVLVANDLAPADTAALDLTDVLAHRHRARRPDQPHRDPRRPAGLPASSACRRDRARRRHAGRASTPPPAIVDHRPRRRAREAERRSARSAGRGPGREPRPGRDRRRPRRSRCWPTSARSRTPDAAGRGRTSRASGLFRTEFAVPRPRRPRRPSSEQAETYTAGVRGRSAPARSSSARWTPAPTSRWRSPTSARRRTRRSASRAAPVGAAPGAARRPARGARRRGQGRPAPTCG